MEKDIVCGKDVPTSTPFKTPYGDQPYYFCSKKCELDFAGNPLRYVDKSRSVSSLEGTDVISSEGKKEHFDEKKKTDF